MTGSYPDAVPLAERAGTLWRGLLPLVTFALLALAIMAGSRGLLALVYAGHFADARSVAALFLRAWRFDVSVVSGACLVAVLPLWLAPSRWLSGPAWPRLQAAWLTAWLVFIAWNEAATADFLAEFGVRPNRLYFEYLDSPAEVLGTLWAAHRLALLLGIALAVATGVLGWRLFLQRPARPPPWLVRGAALAPLVLALFVGLRGSVGHRPLNISYAATSTDPVINELALNSTYSALRAAVQAHREASLVEPYGRLPAAEVIRRVRRQMQLPAAAFVDPAKPMEHELKPTGAPSLRPNLVILLQESLGAQYVASLGGRPVATEIDSWRSRSFWLDQLYATGTRSARGLEAVVTGFLPTRSPGVLKLEGSQHDFFTLARALKAAGYRTEFIYGGDSSFDNMRRFFLNNGFDRVLDWSDLRPDARFATTWGVSDEDLYARVHREIGHHREAGRPFFTLVFSTSNHPPYDFPDGRIALYEQPKNTQNNAARYADFAVGGFLARAARSRYWENTLFMVVADHEARTAGEGLVPIASFRIPGFIAGGPVRPRVIPRIASQVDLIPTVLSLMGIDAWLPAPGIDLSRGDLTGPGRAIMQFHDDAAYRVGNDVVVLRAGHAPAQFRMVGRGLVPEPSDPQLIRDALALTQWPAMAYRDKSYQ